MTEMFGEAWPPISVPDLAPDDDDEFSLLLFYNFSLNRLQEDKAKATSLKNSKTGTLH